MERHFPLSISRALETADRDAARVMCIHPNRATRAPACDAGKRSSVQPALVEVGF
jgi:hypothetical protein